MRQVWQARDGRVFRTEAECTKHEETIPSSFTYKDKYVDSYNLHDVVYYINDGGIYKGEIVDIEHCIDVDKYGRTDYTVFTIEGYSSGTQFTCSSKHEEISFTTDWRDFLHFDIY